MFLFKPVYIVVTVLLLIVGVLISNSFIKIWGKDPRKIVIDEYACLLLPLYFTPKRIIPLIITFVLFRIFDILKPPPIRKLEELPGGWGIMLDDLGAALYTTVVIVVITLVFKI